MKKTVFKLGKGEPDYLSVLAGEDQFVMDGVSFFKSRMVIGEQVHGDHIHICDPDDSGAGFGTRPPIAGADGMITANVGQYLTVRTADCSPVLLMDTECRAVAAIHSGREGTRKNIVGKAVQMLKDSFGILPRDVEAWIGAGICANHYEVSQEIYDDFINAMQAQGIQPVCKGERKLDIRNCIFQQLIAAGIPFRNIDQDPSCSFENTQYHSYRRDGSKNRQLNIVGIEYEQ